MKKIKILLLLSALLLANSCRDFEEFQQDPNRATQTHPSLLLTNIEVSTFSVISPDAALASRMLVYTQTASNSQYYGWQRSGFGRYDQLRQVMKMEEEAERTNLENYKHLATFLRAWHIIELTKVFGDIPYHDALKGQTQGVLTPKYDTQEDIYLSILNDLKTASTSLDVLKGDIAGDVIYNGSILKWKKAINSFSLRLLISLSKKTDNTKLDVINRFREIVSNPSQYPIFTSNADNLALKYYDLAGNRYPYFNNNSFKTDYYLEQSFTNLLKEREDPRLMRFGDKEARNANLPENDFNAYGGLGGSDLLASNKNRLASGEGSPIEARYHSNPVNEPSVALSYPEIEFTLAEAAAKGWLENDPQTHYEKGIKASLQFYEIPQAAQDAYLQHELVQYDESKAIEMIITQKYISFFMNGGWEAFYNHLRTSFPVFDVSGDGILNGGQVPQRWMYPQSELQLNQQNVLEAIKRQYGDDDNINGVMWLLK